ncbi:hypothetical protein [Skermania piniformis]|uniref:Uncharacterized protein n=1 Tax=Skermania pinensis TaxID=39122 RepID=A0ABX8SAF3_9ACTN|nr:hypothetical protein [Skermania piniformis]QXQ13455.1 hypothetical protein KV203_16760 [Skermania piniformis]
MSYKYFADDDYAVYRVDAAAPDEGLAPAERFSGATSEWFPLLYAQRDPQCLAAKMMNGDVQQVSEREALRVCEVIRVRDTQP